MNLKSSHQDFSYNLLVTSKNETTNSPIYQSKMLHNVFNVCKIKKQGLKWLSKKKTRNNTPLKRGLKILSGLLQYFKFVNWWIDELKVRLSQNEFIVSSISKKWPKQFEGFLPWEFLQFIGQKFRVIFRKIDDFINSFWLNLIFSGFGFFWCHERYTLLFSNWSVRVFRPYVKTSLT